MQNRQHAYLLDILRSAEAIEEYISGYTRDRFLEDARTQDAVLRRLLVIGKAAARLTPETRTEFDGLPFHKIVGMRNRVVHDYGQIDLEIIWETAYLHLPSVRLELRAWFERSSLDENSLA
jgi:uncharacterized protein with HEPN domain